MSRAADLEATLAAAYAEEARGYAQALEAARGLAAAMRGGEVADASPRQLLTLLDNVAAVEARIAPDKATWQRCGRPAGPELTRAMAQVAGQIEALLVLIADAQREAEVHRARLQPELDATALGERMRRAYGYLPAAARSEGA